MNKDKGDDKPSIPTGFRDRDPILTEREAAGILRVSVATLRKERQAENITHLKIRGCVRYRGKAPERRTWTFNALAITRGSGHESSWLQVGAF